MAIPSPATAAAPAAAPSPPSSSAAPSSEAPSAEAPSATAAAPAASSAMANSVAEKETAAEPDPDPWPQIEHNYFTSMRLHREREDAALAEAYHAKTDPLRQRLVDNYNAQAELLRQLRALREQYDTAQAELGALEEEWQELMDEKRREREREDEERRAWFRKYRRGGLAYRGAGAATATATATTTAAATAADAAANGSDVNGQGNAERDGERRKVGGSRVDGLDKGGEGEVEAEVSNGQQSQARANGEEQKREENEPEREGSGEEHDKGAAEQAERNGMEVDAQPSALAKSLEVVGFAQGREKGQEHQQPANGDRDAPGVPSSVNDHTEKPRFEPEKVDDDKRASDGQGDTVSEDRPTNEHSSPPVAGQGEGESRTVEAVREDERAKSSLAERNTAEAVPSVTTVKSIEMDSSETVNGFDLPRHIASPPTTEAGSPVKSRTRDQQLESAEPTADAQQGGIENTQNASRVEISGINGTVGRRDGDGDVEMTDAQIRAENDTNSALGNDRPQAASAALGAPASPSSSSELSSRSTTPELDTPVYLGRDPSPPETPEQKSLGNIEILGESGDPIGRVKAEDFGNSVMSRIVQLPVKRPVQICSGRKFTTDDLDAVERPEPGNARPSRFVSLFVQATGELQARPCLDCTADGGPYLDCVMVDDPEFPRCGNCEWNQRRCQGGTTGRASDSRQNLTSKSPADSPTKRRASSGGPTAINPAAENRESREEFKPSTSNSDGRDSREAATKKGPRKSLPGSRNVPLPSTPSTSVQDEGELLPEITKDVLSLKHDGVVFTDPPIMRGVPLAKISPEHPYWEPDWKPLEAIVEPVWQKHQEKYDQLERSGTTYRDKHLANRDAKRGRLILKFLEEGDLHPYQLVGKQWINHRLTNYDTLYRLAQLLTDELPKMNLDVTPSEWLRHRLHELYLEHGDKLDVANWIRRAYHDRKIEQLRLKNGFPRVGRPPAHASKSTEPGGSSKKATGPRSLKRKDPHQTPESTPSKSKTGSTLRESPSAASDAGSSSAAATAKTGGPGQQPKPKKIKIITSQPQLQPSSKPPSTKAPKIILNSPYPPSATSDKAPALKGSRAAAKGKEDDQGSALEYDGYTSSDSISGDTLHVNDWRLHQVKTRTFATNPQVTQYWHWVTEQKEHNLIEHQVLESVGPPVKWSIFKRPYNFHLKLPDIQEVSFARASNRVVVTHRRGRDGKDLAPRGDIMAEFKRDRTKRRFLTFLRRDKGVKVIELSRDAIEAKWNSLSPETLPGPDSD